MYKRLLFPKADVQITKNRVELGAAFGHKRTFAFRTHEQRGQIYGEDVFSFIACKIFPCSSAFLR